jgi:Fe-S-cluster-containing dehydrogenase component
MAENKLQKGFIFRQENCVGCGGCTIACQIHNELPEDVRFRKVDLYEAGSATCGCLMPACTARTRAAWLSARPAHS